MLVFWVCVIPCRSRELEEVYQSSERHHLFLQGQAALPRSACGEIGRLFWLLLQPEQSRASAGEPRWKLI